MYIRDDGLFRSLAIALFSGGRSFYFGFRRPDGQAFLDNQPRDLNALRGLLQAQKSLSVAGGKLTFAQIAQDLAVQLQQAHGIRYGRPRLTNSICHRFLSQAEVAHQRGDAQGFVDGIQICPLQVFNQGQDGAGCIARLDDAGGYCFLPQVFKGTKSALPGDQFKAVLNLTNDDRLQKAFRTNGFG